MLPERAALLLAHLAPDFLMYKCNFAAEMSLTNSPISSGALGWRQPVFFAPLGVSQVFYEKRVQICFIGQAHPRQIYVYLFSQLLRYETEKGRAVLHCSPDTCEPIALGTRGILVGHAG
jgi:hypothetical protein